MVSQYKIPARRDFYGAEIIFVPIFFEDGEYGVVAHSGWKDISREWPFIGFNGGVVQRHIHRIRVWRDRIGISGVEFYIGGLSGGEFVDMFKTEVFVDVDAIDIKNAAADLDGISRHSADAMYEGG